nr:MAG TPA: hypothetical protein [Caudoviricetes sp.]
MFSCAVLCGFSICMQHSPVKRARAIAKVLWK